MKSAIEKDSENPVMMKTPEQLIKEQGLKSQPEKDDEHYLVSFVTPSFA